MIATSTRRLTLLAAGLAASVILALAFPALTFGDGDDGRCEDERIVSRSNRVDYRTYAHWTVAWWQWATSFDLASNPILDPEGSQAANGQSGPMWFLAGTFGGSAVRNVTIPAGKHLLIPVINGEWDTVPGFQNPLGLPDPLSVPDIRKIVAYGIDGAEIACTIDDREVCNLRSFRVRSPVFSMNMNAELASAFGYPAPYVRTAVSDGYWLIVKPLSAGQHTIHFAASNERTGFALDVTYNLTIEP